MPVCVCATRPSSRKYRQACCFENPRVSRDVVVGKDVATWAALVSVSKAIEVVTVEVVLVDVAPGCRS